MAADVGRWGETAGVETGAAGAAAAGATDKGGGKAGAVLGAAGAEAGATDEVICPTTGAVEEGAVSGLGTSEYVLGEGPAPLPSASRGLRRFICSVKAGGASALHWGLIPACASAMTAVPATDGSGAILRGDAVVIVSAAGPIGVISVADECDGRDST